MKNIYMTLAAVSALAVTAPVAAQSWYGSDRPSSEQLQMRFEAGVQSGAISRNEARLLRSQLRELTTMERNYSRSGFNRWESRALRERSRTLNLEMSRAERAGNGRFGQGDRYGAGAGAGYDDRRGYEGRDGLAMDGRVSHRGDRFAGDLRVGQHFSARQVALPMEYRDRYRDSDAAFYRYDDRRVYHIDRASGLILAMFDIGG
jgi:hypothetical protein